MDAKNMALYTLASTNSSNYSLDRLIQKPLDTEKFLEMAIQITNALAELHRQGIIHKDLKPQNFLIHPETDEVKIIGLNISTQSSNTLPPSPSGASRIEGSFPYMSPEQTGRMNRAIDSRTDLYSLGIIFFQMLTGRFPFEVLDPLEWVLSHVAREPPPPSQYSENIPEVISKIILRLLAKLPEDRYQCPRGLQTDLEKCLLQWRSFGRIDSFVLGERDISDRLQSSQKLYGRDQQISDLLSAFERVAKTKIPELVAVSGYSGVGKSSLVRQIQRPITQKGGRFREGKFDQYMKGTPFSTIAAVFRDLVLDLLILPELQRKKWAETIQTTLGPGARLITDLIPALRHLIGEFPPLPELSPIDAKQHFLQTFNQFVHLFTQDSSLVLFFDDVQWADPASLELLQDLVTDRTMGRLLIVIAYRDNEVPRTHPLIQIIEQISKSQVKVTRLILQALSLNRVAESLADVLRSTTDWIWPLAVLIHRKTGGNPFFMSQFIATLHKERLLYFDENELVWHWNIERIQEKEYTDNLADFMVMRLAALPPSTQEILKIAASLGNRQKISTLACVYEKTEAFTLNDLSQAIHEDLILLSYDSCDYFFAHDRIQQAAYSLIPIDLRAQIHLRIGRLLVANTPYPLLEEKIFEIVNQFGRGIESITSPEEREKVAELNLIAGRRAKESAAYASALHYFAKARTLLTEWSWEQRYELIFPIELNYAECECLTGEFSKAEKHFLDLLNRARNIVDAASVVCKQEMLYTILGRPDRGISAVINFLRPLGIEWTPHPTEEDVQREFGELWKRLGARSIEELIDLPKMTDPNWQATLEVLMWSQPMALLTDANLFSLLAARMTNLSLEYGYSDASGLGYVMLGLILRTRFNQYQASLRFGKLAVDLIDKRNQQRFKAQTYLTFGHWITPWTQPIAISIEWTQRAFEAAQQSGHLTFASYSCHVWTTFLLASGAPLKQVQLKAEEFLSYVQKTGFGMIFNVLMGLLMMIKVARGKIPKFTSLNGTDLSSIQFEQNLEKDSHLPIASCCYWISKLQAQFLMGNFLGALDAALKAQPMLWTIPAFFEVTDYHFYKALAHTAQFHAESIAIQKNYLEIILEHLRQIRIWAEYCPENFKCRNTLVEAELARIQGRTLDAEHFYEDAIHSARENGFIQIEGLSYELASNFYRTRGFVTFADTYLRLAHTCYLRWGAEGKASQLEQLYPQLVVQHPFPSAPTVTMNLDQLDFLSVIKASQSISQEIILDNLNKRLLYISLEQSGAQNAFLLFSKNGFFSIEAEAHATETDKSGKPPNSQSIGDPNQLPVSILQYVARTRELVLLADAYFNPAQFSAEEYIQREKPRSILCLPILRQKELSGILYLENRITSDVFSSDRLRVLELLASQAAISMENAGLFQKLQNENEKRKKAQEELNASREQLKMIIDSTTSVIFVKDVKGRYLLINRRFEDLFHIKNDQIIGKTDFDLFPKEIAEGLQIHDWKALQAGGPSEFEENVPHEDGFHTYISIKFPLFTRSSERQRKPYAICGIATDITERKLVEQARERLLAQEQVARQEAEKSVAVREDFLAIAAHELRTPLTPLKLQIQILQRILKAIPKNAFPQLEQFVKLSNSTDLDLGRLSALVDNLLDVSRITAGQLYLKREEVDLSRLIQEIINKYSSEIQKSRCRIEMQLEPQVRGFWDPVRIEQIAVNLLTNALKYGNGKPIKVQVSSMGPLAQLSVRDYGIGIEKEAQARIFNRFERAGSVRHFGGLGLGLYITSHIVASHGGNIKVKSTPGQGSTFTVSLPLKIESI